MNIPEADLPGFDEALYLQRYEDVAQAVARGEWSSGYEHYCTVGRSDGWHGSPEVDEKWYGSSYPLAGKDIEAGWATDLVDHYLRIGRHRGYLPNKLAPRLDDAARHQSRFGGLWPDQANALDLVRGRLELRTITEGQAALLYQWIDQGYVVIENAIPEAILDRALQEVNQAYEGGFPQLKFNVHTVGRNLSWVPEVKTNATKAQDLHWFSEPLRDIIACDKLIEFLHLIFERRALATQTLTFWRGSAQDAHQDSAYVNYSLPMQFCASWIALEDVVEGAGELFYHVGGQRMPEYLYRGRYKGAGEAARCHPDWAMNDEILKHVKSIKSKAAGMSLETKRFLAKPGDVLFWSADLPHGGSPISPTITRKSIVTHYCPSEVAPSYFEGSGRNDVRDHHGKLFYSSGHYGRKPA